MITVYGKDRFRFTYQRSCMVLDFYEGRMEDAGAILNLKEALYCEKIPVSPENRVEAELVRDGKSLRVTARTGERELAGLLGSPGNRDEDEEEIILSYRFGSLGLEIELTKAGFVKRVDASLDEEEGEPD